MRSVAMLRAMRQWREGLNHNQMCPVLRRHPCTPPLLTISRHESQKLPYPDAEGYLYCRWAYPADAGHAKPRRRPQSKSGGNVV